MSIKSPLIYFGFGAIFLLHHINSVEIDGNQDICPKLLNGFSENQTEFIHCAIKHSEPVTYCDNCFFHYRNLTIAYLNFTGNPNCSAIYIDNDRLNIIQTTFADSRNLWNAGSCSECYGCPNDILEPNCTLSDITKEFSVLHINLTDCILHREAPCDKCKGHYEELNLMYNQMKSKRGEKICFDIKDAMNKTRIKWSKELKCCDNRNPSQVAFFSLASVLCGIAMLFYLGIYAYEKRQERTGYEPMDNDTDVRGEIVIVGPSTSNTSNDLEGSSQQADGPSQKNQAQSSGSRVTDAELLFL